MTARIFTTFDRINNQGEYVMKLTYEKKEAMTFIGYHTEIEPDEGYIKCPEFWEKEFNEKYARL